MHVHVHVQTNNAFLLALRSHSPAISACCRPRSVSRHLEECRRKNSPVCFFVIVGVGVDWLGGGGAGGVVFCNGGGGGVVIRGGVRCNDQAFPPRTYTYTRSHTHSHIYLY